jgi:hypothetical protein
MDSISIILEVLTTNLIINDSYSLPQEFPEHHGLGISEKSWQELEHKVEQQNGDIESLIKEKADETLRELEKSVIRMEKALESLKQNPKRNLFK